jgi:hypothetical protein
MIYKEMNGEVRDNDEAAMLNGSGDEPGKYSSPNAACL